MSKIDMAKSIHQRLLNVRDKTGEPFNNLLVRYGMERLLDEMDHQARPALASLRKGLKDQPNKYIIRVINKGNFTCI